MQIIPAIDIKNGKCVRLTQGKADTEIVYGEDPLAMAMHWQKQGAKYLHLVDLDGAFQGKTVNFKIMQNIILNLNIPVEIGGGIRTLKSIKKYIDTGADRIILGTKVAGSFEFLQKTVKLYPGKIAVSIDASEGKVVTEGWIKKTDITAISLAQKVKSIGVDTIIYTDIATDGMLKGPNFKDIEELAKALQSSTEGEKQINPAPSNEALDLAGRVIPQGIPNHTSGGDQRDVGRRGGINIIASGGIVNIEDIKKLVNITGISGIIIGKALYAGKIELKEALKYRT